ncbi:MAG: flagellar hook assembly protein FlgD [Desulfobacteraceae bacterium]|nr:MAG: flagellar hook assembly protein FlgD [Desulfobacteraceae bacterium]
MDPIQALGQSDWTESKAAAKSRELGKDDFLTMFVAQVKNQDPLNPMQGQEFAAQLAQFSSLEQLFNVNESLQSLKTAQDDASRLQGIELIGKEILAKGNSLELEQGKVVTGRFELEEKAQCTVAVLNRDGYLVRSIPLGTLEAGSNDFQWDGRDGNGNLLSPGTYRFSVVAKTATGELVSGDPRVSGKVTGVNLQSGAASLYVGQIPISLSDVMEVVDPVEETS